MTRRIPPAQQCGALLIRDGRVLLCLRSSARALAPGVWDVPGGHVEPGERGPQALVRELREELGIAIEEPADPPFADVGDPARGFDLLLWRLERWAGEPRNLQPAEHDSIGWFLPCEARVLALALPEYPALIDRAVAVRFGGTLPVGIAAAQA